MCMRALGRGGARFAEATFPALMYPTNAGKPCSISLCVASYRLYGPAFEASRKISMFLNYKDLGLV